MFKKAFGLAASASAAAAIATAVWAQTGDPPKGKSIEELGRVVFQTSCKPHAQAQLERERENTTAWKQIAGYSTAFGRVVAEGIVPRLPEK